MLELLFIFFARRDYCAFDRNNDPLSPIKLNRRRKLNSKKQKSKATNLDYSSKKNCRNAAEKAMIKDYQARVGFAELLGAVDDATFPLD